MTDTLTHQFAREMAGPGAWFLLLLPLFLFLGSSLATLFGHKRLKGDQQLQHHRLPPSPPALPVLGHLHLIGSLPHVTLRHLAKKHGMDMMLLRLGTVPVLVVSSPHAAEAVLRTHDHVFVSRPHFLAAEVILYGPADVGFTSYGANWRRAKKLVTTHLLSARRVQEQEFRRAREEEVGMAMAQVAKATTSRPGSPVDVSELFHSYTNDLVCRAVMGKRLFRSEGRNKLFQKLVMETSPVLGGFNIEDFFPFLDRFGITKVVRAKYQRLSRRWDEQLDMLIQDHERKHESSPAGAANYQEEGNDFIHILLSVRQEYGVTREQMKGLLLDVFFGGIDASASVLDFTMAELMRTPRVMKKLQAEVRRSVPAGQDIVSEGDLKNMTYLRAVIKESLWLGPVAPLLAPHCSMADCSIDGLDVPAGTRVLINAWAIARDERFWREDPEEFIPERFLDDGGAAGANFTGTDFQFLPFGSGRRMCPGMNLGMATVELMLANLMHHFDWEMLTGKEARDIDMSQVFGLVVHRKKKLLLVPKLRVL